MVVGKTFRGEIEKALFGKRNCFIMHYLGTLFL